MPVLVSITLSDAAASLTMWSRSTPLTITASAPSIAAESAAVSSMSCALWFGCTIWVISAPVSPTTLRVKSATCVVEATMWTDWSPPSACSPWLQPVSASPAAATRPMTDAVRR